MCKLYPLPPPPFAGLLREISGFKPCTAQQGYYWTTSSVVSLCDLMAVAELLVSLLAARLKFSISFSTAIAFSRLLPPSSCITSQSHDVMHDIANTSQWWPTSRDSQMTSWIMHLANTKHDRIKRRGNMISFITHQKKRKYHLSHIKRRGNIIHHTSKGDEMAFITHKKKRKYHSSRIKRRGNTIHHTSKGDEMSFITHKTKISFITCQKVMKCYSSRIKRRGNIIHHALKEEEISFITYKNKRKYHSSHVKRRWNVVHHAWRLARLHVMFYLTLYVISKSHSGKSCITWHLVTWRQAFRHSFPSIKWLQS